MQIKTCIPLNQLLIKLELAKVSEWLKANKLILNIKKSNNSMLLLFLELKYLTSCFLKNKALLDKLQKLWKTFAI